MICGPSGDPFNKEAAPLPYDPERRAFTLTTFRDFMDDGLVVSAHCYARACGHKALLDLQVLAARFGIDSTFDRRKLRCSACGSRNVQIRVSAEIRRRTR